MADIEHTGAQVRRRFRDLEPFSNDNDNKAFAEYISAAPVTPLGHIRQSVSNTPEGFDSVPVGTKRVHIYNLSEDTDVFFTDFPGDVPSSSLGFPIKANSWFLYDVEPGDDFLMATISGSASLAIAFYG